MARPTRHLAAATAAAALVIAGCGDDAATSSTTTSAPITTTGAVTSVASSAPATTGGGVTTTAGAVTIEVGYAGGSITGGGKRSAARGQSVIIKVTSDVVDEIHLHGYDKKADAGPGKVATITFVADKPGIFEVELEKKGLKLFELEVK